MRLPARVGGICVALLTACAAEREPSRDILATDDFGDTVHVGTPALRIVSLNPTTTELLFAVGAGSRLVGRTRWDVYPESAKYVPDLGDGIRPNVEVVLAARPDLVVLYAGESNRPAAAEFRAAGINTISLKIDSIAEFSRALRLLGAVTGESARAKVVDDSVRATLDAVRLRTAARPPPRPTVVWPAWQQPLMVIGGGSFLSELVTIAGGRNVYDSLAGPSPQVSFEDIVRRDPDFVLTGPVTARQLRADPAWRPLRAVREGRILVIDTALMLRPSVKLGEAAVSLERLLHPDSSR